MTAPKIIWAHSTIKMFEQCPKKYYHLKVAKDVKDSFGEEALYGIEMHKAAENYVREQTPLPDKFSKMKKMLDSVISIKGDHYCELKLGVSKVDGELAPCKFFDDDVWWRGVADFVSVNGSQGYSIDYKTGKNTKYADMTQLDLVAAALFLKFPELETIKSALLYVACNEFLTKNHTRSELNKYMSQFDGQLLRLEAALQNQVWNAKQGPLCGWCPVESCVHNKG